MRDASTWLSLTDGWEEAEYYYNNAQQNHRKETMAIRVARGTTARIDAIAIDDGEHRLCTMNAVIPNVREESKH